VVSKPQIRFKGPACQWDFASDLFKLRCSARRGQSATNIGGPLEPLEHLK
jgi:hypothetical protein